MKAWIYVKRNSRGQLLRESEKLIEEVETLKENPKGEAIEIKLVDVMSLDELAEKVASGKSFTFHIGTEMANSFISQIAGM